MEFSPFFFAVENTLCLLGFYRLGKVYMYLHILTCISTRKNGNRERERESACLLFSFSFLVHKIRLGMHDSFLSFQVLFLFSRQDIGI